SLLVGVFAGVAAVCAYALATRLFPDHFGAPDTFSGLRLSRPVGYWNALGLVAVMGILLALPIVARAQGWIARALAAAPLPILLTTLYFTFSRGAWLAFGVGLVVLFAADTRRLQLLATSAPLALVAAITVLQASGSHALTHTGASASAAAHAGHRLAAIVVIACLVSAYAGVAVRSLERAVNVPRRAAAAAGWAALAAVALGLVAVFVHYGSPVALAHRAYHSIESNPPATRGDLNNRLFSLSSNGRLAQWRVAVHMFERKPLTGLGAGSYEQEWYLHRPGTWKVQDAHSLYVETLGESGIVGLLLLAAALVAPLLCVRRARREPLAAGALAAYVAYLAHAAVDWDWELTGVTLVALLCGGALLATQRSDARAGRLRLVPIVLGLVVALASFGGLVGNLALSASAKAVNAGNWNHALKEAQRAQSWAPWSATPWQRLAEAELGLGDRTAALASYRTATSKSPDDWRLWREIANVTTGPARAEALAQVRRLDPLDPTGSGN
ncbi:MAG TPA: O-antigen ligase family protein, partial [Gaiellaceae bacterium]|nr:O-antigen ligase family protein [Gaiellaceae bacterium]